MQPLYQVPGEIMAAHLARLQNGARVRDCPPRLYALLFLSGLRIAFQYYCAANAGNEFLTNYAPAHHLDDGLDSAGGRALEFLVKRTRSHASWPELKALHAGKVPKFVAVSVAFVGLFDECSPKVREWIARGDAETNRARLSFSMGVQAMWQWKPIGYIPQMMRESLGLDAEELAALKAFSISAGTALPEL